MKYGAHNYLFTSAWSDAHLPLLKTARELGLSCFEISVGDDVTFTPKKTRQAASEQQLELIISPGGLWPDGVDVSSDNPEERARGVAWHKRQLELASEVGAVAYAGALYGRPGVVRKRTPDPDEFVWTAEGVHDLAAYGAALGVRVVLEPMSHFRTHLVNTPEQAMKLIDAAEHKNVFVLLDTYHLITEIRDYAAAVHTVKERLFSVHACGSDRGVPGGDFVPWDAFFGALKDIGFDKYLLFETYNSSVGDFAYKRGLFHNVCPDGEAFVRDGLKFVRSHLE